MKRIACSGIGLVLSLGLLAFRPAPRIRLRRTRRAQPPAPPRIVARRLCPAGPQGPRSQPEAESFRQRQFAEGRQALGRRPGRSRDSGLRHFGRREAGRRNSAAPAPQLQATPRLRPKLPKSTAKPAADDKAPLKSSAKSPADEQAAKEAAKQAAWKQWGDKSPRRKIRSI